MNDTLTTTGETRATIILEIAMELGPLAHSCGELTGFSQSNYLAVTILAEALNLALLHAGIAEPALRPCGTILNAVIVIMVPAKDVHPAIRAMQAVLGRLRLLAWSTIHVVDLNEGFIRPLRHGLGRANVPFDGPALTAKLEKMTAEYDAKFQPLILAIQDLIRRQPAPPENLIPDSNPS